MVAPRPRASVAQRGQAAVRKPAAPSDGPKPSPVAHQGWNEEQGCRSAGRYPTSLVLAMVMMDLLPGTVEFRTSTGASDFLDFHTRVGWLLFSRLRTSGMAFNVACLLLSLSLGSPGRLACPLQRFPKCFLFVGLWLRILEECPSPSSERFLLHTIYVIYLKQAYVRVLVFSTSIYALQSITDCFRKVLQFRSPRADTERSMAKQQASRSDLKEKIRNLEDQVECLKAAVQLAEKGSSVCKICYDREVGCALEPCRHHAFCLRCSQRLADLKEKCPLCREEVTGLIETFVS